MDYAVLDACFSENKQSGAGMSAHYLKWELRKRGIEEVSSKDADILLVSCQSVDATGFLKALRKRYPGKIIIAGGAASTSPHSLGLFSDAVCVGDGQRFIDVLTSDGFEAAKRLPNIWVEGEERPVEVDMGFPWGMPPIMSDDNEYKLWCGRGCKKKCLFCQTGWAYRYSENPNPNQVIEQAAALQKAKRSFGYLSNDLMQHSFGHLLPPTQHGSYSVQYMQKHGLPPARHVRIGVEGVSERLRASVNKPFSGEDLVYCTAWLNSNKKSVRWFLVAGLPEDKKEDWEELKENLLQWKMETEKGVLAVSFTAFCPEPATPFAIQPLDDAYYERFLDFKNWFFYGIGWSNRIKLLPPQSPKSRLKKAMLAMGLSEKELREGGHWGPNDRVAYPYKLACKAIAEKIQVRQEVR